jgi:hypothetical protein
MRFIVFFSRAQEHGMGKARACLAAGRVNRSVVYEAVDGHGVRKSFAWGPARELLARIRGFRLVP